MRELAAPADIESKIFWFHKITPGRGTGGASIDWR